MESQPNDSVRVEDYILFCTQRIKHFEHMLELEQQKWGIAKIKYDCTWYARIFNWRFEDSDLSDKSWFGDYKFWSYESWKEYYNKELNRVEYQKKVGIGYILISNKCRDKFYEYCKENNIPY